VSEWLDRLASSKLSFEQKAIVAFLDDLSCPPLKFDSIWEFWPDFGIAYSGYAALAGELLSAVTEDEMLRGASAFDDLTIFCDIAGDSSQSRPFPRSAYRAAYLALRPILARTSIGDPPAPPQALDEQQFVERAAFAVQSAPDASLADIVGVLGAAAERYAARGKASGQQVCRLAAELVTQLAAPAMRPRLRGMLRQSALQLFFSGSDAALAYEIGVQWYRVFGSDFASTIVIRDDGDAGASESVDFLRDLFEKLAPLHWLTETRPGIGATIAILAITRNDGDSVPPSFFFLPVTWFEAARECVTLLRNEWKGTPLMPEEVLNAALDALVKIEHQARTSATRGPNPLLREGLAYVELLNLITRRARQELSSGELAEALRSLHARQQISSFTVEGVLTQAAMAINTEPAFARAAGEVAMILAHALDNPNLLTLVDRALGRESRENLRESGERLLRQGRPDLAALAFRNLGVQRNEQGDRAGALTALRRGWDVLQAIERGDEYVSKSAVYDRAATVLLVGEPLAGNLVGAGELAAGLRIIDATLAASSASDEKKEILKGDQQTIARIRMLALAAHCENQLHGLDAAEARLAEGARIAEESNSPLASSIALTTLATAAAKRGDFERDVELLLRAQSFADEHRRSSPFELDKAEAATATQAAYMWAGERLVEAGRTWEALAAFEGLRSRALLDMLGLAPAIQPGVRLPEELAGEGRDLLKALRAIATPGEMGEAWGIRGRWIDRLHDLDEWLLRVDPIDPEYAQIVRGASANATVLRQWFASAAPGTAVITWCLGEHYSFAVALAGTSAPVFRRINTTLGWLRDRAEELQQFVRARRNPPRQLIEALSQHLVQPVADAIRPAAAVYFNPTQSLHSLPLGALVLDGMPIAIQKNVGVVPSISVLRVLDHIDRQNNPSGGVVVCGPKFPEHARRIADLHRTQPARELTAPGLRLASRDVAECEVLHLICHGTWNERDPWGSGFDFGDEILTGRDLLQWRLKARLAALEACDTHRNASSITEDNFGMARFFHLVGVPSLLLSDWEVRSDASQVFMNAFYEQWQRNRPMGRGAAYRAGVRALYDWAGAAEFFLWAPFTLVGLAG
jgi:CHAT domain-containing protein